MKIHDLDEIEDGWHLDEAKVSAVVACYDCIDYDITVMKMFMIILDMKTMVMVI